MLNKLSEKLVKSVQVLFAECDHRVLTLQDENTVLRNELLYLREQMHRASKEHRTVRDNLINTLKVKTDKLELLEAVTRQGLSAQEQSKLLTEILFDIDVDQINEVLRSIHAIQRPVKPRREPQVVSVYSVDNDWI